jgi:phenylacetate-CoA ligase
MIDPDLTDAERYPTLTEHGQRMLDRLRQHPHAPLYRNRAGNRLTAEDLARVRAFEAEGAGATIEGRPGARPRWLADFVAQCYRDVPFYRALGTAPGEFGNVPPISRADFAGDITQFVPDSVALDRLINFRTSGTTGHPLLIPSHPVVAASYIAFHKRALRRFGIELQSGRGNVAVVLLGYQRQCFTYASVAPLLDEAGYAKINLHADDWRDPQDRARYLDALQPEIFSGDPLSFAVLLDLPVTWKPRALVSTSMTLLPALRARLEARFECPVLDVYSMNESGPIAVADPRAGGHVLLQHQLLVEILHDGANPCAPGVRGEITLTGGFNFCLPLLRYRTGDYAALEFNDAEWVLTGLEGRAPMRFRAATGAWINNVELTHALRGLPLLQFRAHQHADGCLRVDYAAASRLDSDIAAALRRLFGEEQPFVLSLTAFDGGKLAQYSTDFPDAP